MSFNWQCGVVSDAAFTFISSYAFPLRRLYSVERQFVFTFLVEFVCDVDVLATVCGVSRYAPVSASWYLFPCTHWMPFDSIGASRYNVAPTGSA